MVDRSMPTRERLVVAMGELLRRQGYGATTVKQLTEAAGATMGSLYHHFPGGTGDVGTEHRVQAGDRPGVSGQHRGQGGGLHGREVGQHGIGAQRGRLASAPAPRGGYAQIFHDHVQGADTGADFDFLIGCRGADVGKDSH